MVLFGVQACRIWATSFAWIRDLIRPTRSAVEWWSFGCPIRSDFMPNRSMATSTILMPAGRAAACGSPLEIARPFTSRTSTHQHRHARPNGGNSVEPSGRELSAAAGSASSVALASINVRWCRRDEFFSVAATRRTTMPRRWVGNLEHRCRPARSDRSRARPNRSSDSIRRRWRTTPWK
jgi:hypothetical protein